MVIDRITDGRRIAQLLASELDGREDGGLEAVSVVNADRNVEPTASGARAYDVVVPTAADDGEPLARVFVHPNRARVVLEADRELVEAAAAGVKPELEIEVEDAAASDEANEAADSATPSVIVDSGAAVKRATDVIQRVLAGN